MAGLATEGTEIGAGYTWKQTDVSGQTADADGFTASIEHRVGNGFFLEGDFSRVEDRQDSALSQQDLSLGGGLVLEATPYVNILLSAGYTSQNPSAFDNEYGGYGHYVTLGFESELSNPGLVLNAEYNIRSMHLDGTNEIIETLDVSLEQEVLQKTSLVAGLTVTDGYANPYLGAKYRF